MTQPSFDTLSAPARQLIAGARAAGRYERLVVRERTAPNETPPLLETTSLGDLFSRPVARADDARCVLAGLWLLFDELDRAHHIVQDVALSSGSFWHAIVHRREGDFSNSRYWYARAAGHAVLRDAEVEIAGAELVDLVERVVDLPDTDPRAARAVLAQQSEWALLLDHCARSAVGGGA